MSEKTINFEFEKATKNKIRFKEVVDGDNTPIVETLYLPKWLVKDKTKISIKILDLD
jgi:hypothetical protein